MRPFHRNPPDEEIEEIVEIEPADAEEDSERDPLGMPGGSPQTP